MQKTILITGANKGIGLETARQLGHLGHRVIVSARDADRLDKAIAYLAAEGITATPLLMDVSDTLSIARAADLFADWKMQLDVIINNAAILLGTDQKILQKNGDVFVQTILTNCHGPLNVVKTFLPFMTRGGRIINLSSGGGSMTDPVGGWAPAYCASKSFLNSITRQMAHELRDQQIAVNAVCPGWVRTDMGGAGASRPVGKGAETPVWLAVDAQQSVTGKFFRDKKEIPW